MEYYTTVESPLNLQTMLRGDQSMGLAIRLVWSIAHSALTGSIQIGHHSALLRSCVFVLTAAQDDGEYNIPWDVREHRLTNTYTVVWMVTPGA